MGSADIITVDDDGNGDYGEIQDAINASQEGDTIQVFEGTYYENIIVNKSVNLIGNGSEDTTIDGDVNGAVVNITADWVNMSNFKVIGSRLYNVEYYTGIKIKSNNSNIFDNNCSYNYHGIYLWDSSNCTIESNTCENNKRGIYFLNSSDCTIESNTCENNYFGIHLSGNTNNTISNNSCSNNIYDIFLFPFSNYNTFSKNTFSSNGIYLLNSDYNTFHNNTFSNSRFGILLQYSKYNILTNNQFKGSGVYFSGSLEHWNTHSIDTTNTVNGKPIRYYINSTGKTVPKGAGQIILADCTQMIVENQNLSNGSVGILIGYSSFIKLSSNTCSHNEYGIELYSSNFITLTNNNCSWNNREGITLTSSDNNTLVNNTCSNNRDGISLSASHNNSLLNNSCSNNHWGILLSHADWNVLSNNTIFKNMLGIQFKRNSIYNIAHNNNIFNNSRTGIDASDNDGYTINAIYNWWGYISGPHHPQYNSAGKGDDVTDYVDFYPWLDEYGNVYEKERNGEEEDEEDDENNTWVLFLLIFILMILLVLLIAVIIFSHMDQKPKDGI